MNSGVRVISLTRWATAPPALAGQTALVTGGARRVGAEIVKHLHAAGATVAIHCHRSLAEAQALAAELDARRGSSAAVFAADLLQTEAVAGDSLPR